MQKNNVLDGDIDFSQLLVVSDICSDNYNNYNYNNDNKNTENVVKLIIHESCTIWMIVFNILQHIYR